MHSQHPLTIIGFAPLVVVVTCLLLYLAAVIRLRSMGKKWPTNRVISFSIGVLLLAVALVPHMHLYAMADIRGHMIQHLIIGMLAPIGLVFGAPMTLTLRSLSKPLSRIIVRFLHSPFVRLLTHPTLALVLNIGGMFLLYLTPLYQLSLSHTFLHVFIHIHFLFAGYLFAWSIVGPDPAPKRPGLSVRLSVLFVAIASHAILSKYMYAQVLPSGTGHSPDQVRVAAQIMYYGGDFSELLLVIALFYLWTKSRRLDLSRLKERSNPCRT